MPIRTNKSSLLRLKLIPIIIKVLFIIPLPGKSQDSVLSKSKVSISGTIGITNNGFSIIPTFSFNKPATLLLLSIKKGKFSFEPDIRLTANGKKGSILLWARYQFINNKRYSFRMGMHPAVNWMPKEILENNQPQELIQLRRFLAWEMSHNFRITKNWGIGIYYLQGNGLQKNGPRTNHFINVNSSVQNIGISKNYRLSFIPAVYYLKVDQTDGYYFTAATTLSKIKSPISIQSIVNHTFSSTLVGNKDLLWNVSLLYKFGNH